MRVLTWVGVSAISAFLGTTGPRAAGCDPVGNVAFVCDQSGPEDLALVPGSEWVLSSGMTAGGAIRLVNVRDRTTTVLFPSATARERLDKKTYDSSPGPIDPAEKDAVQVGFRVDNVRWAPDNTLLAAGQGGTAPSQTSNVAKVDPNSLKFQELVRHPYGDVLTAGTVAIQIGKELWVGSVRGDRIAIFPATPSLP